VRVLHLLNGVVGGAARTTTELAESLREHGVTSLAVCQAPPGFAHEDAELLARGFPDGLEFIELYHMNRRLRVPWYLRPAAAGRQVVRTGGGLGSARRVIELARRWQVDLIHSSTLVTPEGAIAAQVLGIPHLWHVRELVGPGQPFRFHGEGDGLARATEASLLVANSPATLQGIQTVMPGVEARMVPNGLDLSALDAVAAHREPRPQDASRPLVAAMVANLSSRWKRHDAFIAAAATVSRQVPVEFRIYGYDPVGEPDMPGQSYARSLHDLVEHHRLGDRFRFAGFRVDPAEIMAEIDLLVQPSRSESFGRTVVEAMAAGVPVIGVDRGPLPYLVDGGRAGLLVADDPREMGDGIVRLAADVELRGRLAAAARIRARQEFAVEVSAQRIFDLYRQAPELAVTRPMIRAWARVTPGRALGGLASRATSPPPAVTSPTGPAR
jgi:glycosyltransferase involved in cell wall biosynthesis